MNQIEKSKKQKKIWVVQFEITLELYIKRTISWYKMLRVDEGTYRYYTRHRIKIEFNGKWYILVKQEIYMDLPLISVCIMYGNKTAETEK